MPLDLPRELSDKAHTFGESSYGATRVVLVLADGRRIPHVSLAWARQIVKVGSRVVAEPSDVDFRMDQLVDIEAEFPSTPPRPST